MTNKFYVLSSLVAILFATSSNSSAADSAAKPAKSPDVNMAATNFRKMAILNEVHHTHVLEEKLSGSAATQSASAEIKEMSAGMVSDHQKADGDLADLAAKESVALGDFTPADYEKGALDALMKLKGTAYDAAYLDLQRVTHKALDGKLSIWISEEKDGSIKDYLKTIQKTVEHHQKMSAELEKKAKAVKG